MKKIICLLIVVITLSELHAQTITDKLTTAFKVFENDSQLKSAIASLYVIDGVTGNVLFDKNSRIGLAPASTQKIITSAAAYELLGKDFRYQTNFGYAGMLKRDRLSGSIYIKPSGDPTFGSWRWKSTSEDSVMKRVANAIEQTGIKIFSSFIVDATGWEGEIIPGGWIWEDVGNYYGAGAEALSWHENQYDLILKSGKNIGDAVTIVGTKPALYNYNLTSNATSAAKGTGDNTIVYFSSVASTGIVRGTIPIDEEHFVVGAAMPSAQNQFLATLNDSLSHRAIMKELMNLTIDKFSKAKAPSEIKWFHTEVSPPLDSINYWFLKKSINLYGEALAKTIALKQSKTATSENGAEVIKNFWVNKQLGIDKNELNTYDGSGLSPLNRVTTHAQVTVLQYAKKQAWFESYFNCFPDYNGIKMKSGTINRVKGFCGYHTSKEGKQYIFSFLVNNYNGPSSLLVQKMYQVLDVLK